MAKSNPSPTTLRRYLLGELPEAETERLERRALEEEEVFEALLVAEDELFDAHAANELPARQRRLLEQRLDAVPGWRDRAAFARSLRAVARAEAGPDEISGQRFLYTLGRLFHPPVSRASWVVAASALLVAGGLWVARETGHLDSRRAPVYEAQRSPRPASPAPGVHERQVRIQLSPATRSPEPVSTLAIPPGTEWVMLDLDLGGEEGYPTFRARVEDRRGKVVWSRGDLRSRPTADGPLLTLEVPSAQLGAGLHEILVEGEGPRGAAELVGAYELEVQRP